MSVVVENADEVRAKVESSPPSRSGMRRVSGEELVRLRELLSVAKRRVRVYSAAGFVPNAYRWRVRIQYIEAVREGEGNVWSLRVGECDAKRSYGRGALAVVDGRAA